MLIKYLSKRKSEKKMIFEIFIVFWGGHFPPITPCHLSHSHDTIYCDYWIIYKSIPPYHLMKLCYITTLQPRRYLHSYFLLYLLHSQNYKIIIGQSVRLHNDTYIPGRRVVYRNEFSRVCRNSSRSENLCAECPVLRSACLLRTRI